MEKQKNANKVASPEKEDVLIIERHESIAIITLNRPQVLNARNQAMRQALVETCQELENDATVQAIILTGSGTRSFSTGLDLAELAKNYAKQSSGMIVGEWNDISQVTNFPKPTIAAINGLAVGGGLELCLACDIRISAEGARLGFVELRRGTIPGNGGTQRLSRLIGGPRTLELRLTAELIAASKAESFGLVNTVVPDKQLKNTALEWANTISKQAPLALIAAKKAVWEGYDMKIETALDLEKSIAARLRNSEDFKEGVNAFREKRNPIWKGI